MAYVNLERILKEARQGGYAVGAFNIVGDLTARAAIQAAEALGQNIILQTSVKTVKSFGITEMMAFLRPLAEHAAVDVAIHLDHSTDVAFTKSCIDAGWSSVMYDGSKLPLGQNIANTRDIVEYAHAKGVTVEGELGAIVGVEDDIFVEEGAGAHAKPNDCRTFLDATGVDAFAPAVGTAHGVYHGEIDIDYDLFQEINSFSPCPLVLHGGTGLTDDMFYRLIDLGAAKVNISTAIKIAYCQGMKDYMAENPTQNDPLKLDAYVADRVRQVVTEHIRFFSLMDRNTAPFEVDLHCHSTRSDGGDTPKELICNAVERGVKVLAITDHDVLPPEKIEVSGVMVDPVAYAAKKGLTFIPGIEFSCETQVEDVHIVVLGCDFSDPRLLDMNRKIVKSKIDSYQRLTERLTEKGFPVDWEEVLNYDDIPRKPEDVQKKLIFNLMAEKGYTKTWSEAKLLCRNNPEFSVKREKPDAAEIIRLAHDTGGIAILAHPYLIDEWVVTKDAEMERAVFIESLIDAGLDGIEGAYTYDKTTYSGPMAKDEIIARVISDYTGRVAIISGGSDYHADYKKTDKNLRDIGECGITLEYFNANPLLSALRRS
ncbi:ketose-bisphosphate aldolase [Eubacterium barkeri]|uniref:Fructose-bisphosphate aldolase, class II n=1 Tax=Eubacterium barkeri TaxID=1528 RepID=A0A1H3HLY7_EUBBA|nr:ketose-bisphosphate aldolase [Eubacterium barkeri]SDY16523.1 fructose-bisphosphate aldolase, class II [Eubacterium barkeri]